MHWMLLPFRRYADFSGRSTRQEYWMFTLLWWIVIIAGAILIVIGADESAQGGGDSPFSTAGAVILFLWWLGTIVPCLALTVRRLHDQDQSGALLILFIVLNVLISAIGWLVQTVFMCMEGTRGPNKYGPDPKIENVENIFT